MHPSSISHAVMHVATLNDSLAHAYVAGGCELLVMQFPSRAPHQTHARRTSDAPRIAWVPTRQTCPSMAMYLFLTTV